MAGGDDELLRIPPLLGGLVLILGTGTAVVVDARRRRRDLLVEPSDVAVDPEGNGRVDRTRLYLPTVSAATNRVGSFTYITFVMTALVHGACLVLTSMATQVLVIQVVGSLSAASIITTSVVPAKGKWPSRVHIAMGFCFIELSFVWLISVCIWTHGRSDSSLSLFVGRIVLATLASGGSLWSVYALSQTSKIAASSIESDNQFLVWRHRTALGQLFFGLFYAVFFATLAADIA